MISGKKVLLSSNMGSEVVNLIMTFEGKGKYDQAKKLATGQPNFYKRNKSASSV